MVQDVPSELVVIQLVKRLFIFIEHEAPYPSYF
jgi:hypothetical protein